MKKVIITSALIGLLVTGASAEVSTLTAKFAGGCKSENTGICSIRATATGTSLEGEKVLLQRAETQAGPWRYVSKGARSLDSAGRATFKFANKTGCYRVITGENGNDAPDIRSRKVCE